jgi:transcriptional regulator with XRE-family HTH domain
VNLPSIRLHGLAEELKRLRKAAGKTQGEAAAAAGIDRATLSKVENARACPQLATLETLLDLYAVAEPKRAQLWALRNDGQAPEWRQPIPVGITEGYGTFILLESRAVVEHCYETLVVPGLIQTEGYARAHAIAALPDASEDEIAIRVRARMERQHTFLAKGTRFEAILTEAALRYRVGGREVMCRQLGRLLDLCGRPNFTLQVIPGGADAHPSMSGGFCTLEFERGNPGAVYFESATEARFLHKTEEVATYRAIFERLSRVALDQASTERLISRLLADMKREGTT